jgi:NADH:ubiquinone oxidoreductase subunit 3 (subunit A)
VAGRTEQGTRLARLAVAVVPVVFALPILYALVASFLDVVGAGHPFFGDISGSNADARAVSLGVPLYQDPNVGYTPLTYTPLMNILGGALDEITVWDGWLMVLVILADAGMIAVAARLAYRRIDEGPAAMAAAAIGAAGMGALAFWLVGFVPFNSLFVPRPDQLAWAFALTGLVLVPRAARGSVWAGVLCVALLSLGWWTKQPALVAPVTACAWLPLAAMRRTISLRAFVSLAGAIVVVGVGSFSIVAALTDGWSTTFVVDMLGDRARTVSVGSSIHDLITSVAPAAIVAAALWITMLIGRRNPRRWGGESLVRDNRRTASLSIAGVLVLFVLLDVPAAVFFRQAVGSTHNQFVGIAWALALLAALAWGLVQAARVPAVATAGAMVLALFAVSEIGPAARGLHDLDVLVPRKDQRALVFEQPGALVAYARDHLVYHPGYAGVGVDRQSELYPNQFNVNGLNRSGRAAGFLERGLLDRRFDLVYPFSGNGDAGPWEANYFWKLNRVIAAKYRPSTDLPQGLEAARIVPYPFAPFVAGRPLVRRAGPDPAPWMAHCFAPFEIRGTTWLIGEGGGFWCRPSESSDELKLRSSPARVSEIRADGYTAHVAGAILVTARARGAVDGEIGGGEVHGLVGPRRRLRVVVPRGSHGIRLRVDTATHARLDLSGLAAD